MMNEKPYDLLSIGRSSIDLYSQNIGRPFAEISAFDAFVGGCPTNVAVGAGRLGMRVALLTAVGEDPVGDFLLRFLENEGIATQFIPRKAAFRSSAVLLGIEPPDRFPLVYYRQGCADIELTIDDVLNSPWDRARAVLISGTGLSREPSRSATMFAARQAHAHGATVYLDLDFRADQWHDPRAYGVVIASVLPWVQVVLGTQAEVKAAGLTDASQLAIRDAQVSDPTVEGDVESCVRQMLRLGCEALVVKRGAAGSMVYLAGGGVIEANAFQVQVVNILGAGDAFAAGLICARLAGLDWYAALRQGNASGAIVVTRPGCANFMPTTDELRQFVATHGAG